MEQFLEFFGNHPVLFSALAAVLTYIIVMELRRGAGPRTITARETVRLVNDEEAVVLDVREANDYKTGHILNAKNLPLEQLEERAAETLKNKEIPIITYCKSGTISSAACKKLAALGYQKVMYLKSGMYGWQDENLPVVK